MPGIAGAGRQGRPLTLEYGIGTVAGNLLGADHAFRAGNLSLQLIDIFAQRLDRHLFEILWLRFFLLRFQIVPFHVTGSVVGRTHLVCWQTTY